jgi:hypothetical protein
MRECCVRHRIATCTHALVRRAVRLRQHAHPKERSCTRTMSTTTTKKKERSTQREKERERHRQTDTHTYTLGDRHTHTHTHTWRQTDRHTDTETQRQTHTQTHAHTHGPGGSPSAPPYGTAWHAKRASPASDSGLRRTSAAHTHTHTCTHTDVCTSTTQSLGVSLCLVGAHLARTLTPRKVLGDRASAPPLAPVLDGLDRDLVEDVRLALAHASTSASRRDASRAMGTRAHLELGGLAQAHGQAADVVAGRTPPQVPRH